MSFETKADLHHSCHAAGKCCDNPCGARYVKQADGSVEIIDPVRKLEKASVEATIIRRVLGSLGLK